MSPRRVRTPPGPKPSSKVTMGLLVKPPSRWSKIQRGLKARSSNSASSSSASPGLALNQCASETALGNVLALQGDEHSMPPQRQWERLATLQTPC